MCRRHSLLALIALSLATASFQVAGAGAPPAQPERRQYAPVREADFLHVALDVTPDFAARSISATATLRLRPLDQPLRELHLDAVDLRVSSVTATPPLQAWQNTDRQLVLTFAEPVPVGTEITLTIRYTATPAEGLYFRTPEMGYRPGDTHLFTQGESILSRHWFPCFDAPNDKFTSEVICRVPAGMTAVANGRLASAEKDPATGLVAFRWVQDKPHPAYLVALVAGYLAKLEDRHGDVELSFYTPPSAFTNAVRSFAGTADMMKFFEAETGVAYPWAKYAQVCVNDFVAGGMENTTLTILTDGTLFPAETENIRTSQGLVAHELAHQWFGDLVTCKDWSDVWLNEGFATYYEALYDRHKNGRDAFLFNLWNDAQTVLSQGDDTRPIAWRGFENPDEQFSYLAYPKGAWVLHMLRSQLGEEPFRRVVKTYLDRHAYGNVTTADFSRVIEEVSGRSFDQFFDQWVYHGHQPELEVSYTWDETQHLARLNVRQTQALSEKVLLFNFPLPVRFKLKSGAVVDRTLTVKSREEDFYVALPEAPQSVRLDPEFTLLARIKFTPPQDLLAAQLADPSDLIGRLLAVQALSGRTDADSIARLKRTLNEDPFYGVRQEASRALRATHTDEALAALTASTAQPDARVRKQVLADLAGFYQEPALAAALAALDRETNPDVLGEAIQALAPYSDPAIRSRLVTFLGVESFQHGVAEAAIAAMRSQEDPAYVKPLLDHLRAHEAQFTSGGFGNALRTLAHLARRETNRVEVREFLAQQTRSPKRSVRHAAIEALGELGDPQAIAVLHTFALADKDSRECKAAESAIAKLRAARPAPDDLHDLRNEVLGLQKENRELRQSVDEVKRQLETAKAAAPASAAAKKKKK